MRGADSHSHICNNNNVTLVPSVSLHTYTSLYVFFFGGNKNEEAFQAKHVIDSTNRSFQRCHWTMTSLFYALNTEREGGGVWDDDDDGLILFPFFPEC